MGTPLFRDLDPGAQMIRGHVRLAGTHLHVTVASQRSRLRPHV